MDNYGVGDIFQNVHAHDALEGYANMTIDQIDNSCFRDMYMETMEAVCYGDFDEPETPESISESNQNDLLVGMPSVSECGGGCGESCESDSPFCEDDTAYFRSLNNIKGTDPTDAGTFFNLKDRKPSVESMDVDSVKHMINVLPDTELVSYESSGPEIGPYDNEVNESAEIGLDTLGIDPFI